MLIFFKSNYRKNAFVWPQIIPVRGCPVSLGNCSAFIDGSLLLHQQRGPDWGHSPAQGGVWQHKRSEEGHRHGICTECSELLDCSSLVLGYPVLLCPAILDEQQNFLQVTFTLYLLIFTSADPISHFISLSFSVFKDVETTEQFWNKTEKNN